MQNLISSSGAVIGLMKTNSFAKFGNALKGKTTVEISKPMYNIYPNTLDQSLETKSSIEKSKPTAIAVVTTSGTRKTARHQVLLREAPDKSITIMTAGRARNNW
jgi:hypothetical protein